MRGELKRIRNCVGEFNLVYFARFIFFHLAACLFMLYINLQVLRVEIVKSARLSGLDRVYDYGQLGRNLLSAASREKLVFSLMLWTIITSIGLFGFFVFIIARYMRGLTINEEAKYEKARSRFIVKLFDIRAELHVHKMFSYEEIDRINTELFKIYRWILFWDRKRDNENPIKNLFNLLVY